MKAVWTIDEQISWYSCGEVKFNRDVKLSIETLCPDVIRLILDKLPCVDCYKVYSLLCNELKKSIELVPRRLCLHCDLKLDLKGNLTCEVICEEEVFGFFRVGLYPIVSKGYNNNRWVEWSSSEGLVACIAKHTVKKRELAIVVKNIVTGSSTSIEMPRLEKAVDMKVGDDWMVKTRNVYVNIVLDRDPKSETYKIIVIEMEFKYKNRKPERYCTFHIYSSETCEWQKHKEVIIMPCYGIIWYKVKSGFLHFSTRQSRTCQLHVLDTTSMAFSPVSDHMYNRISLAEKCYIEILRPVLFYNNNIVAFGSESEHGELCLFKWDDNSKGWFRLSCVASEKLLEFVSLSIGFGPHVDLEKMVKYLTHSNRGASRRRAATLYWRKKVGVVLKTNINYGLMYDMELNRWECIFHPGLGCKMTATWSCFQGHSNSGSYL